MAGIGFLLRKLSAQDNFSGIIRAYFHSAIVAVGPWILVVLSIGTITIFTSSLLTRREVDEFLAIVVYNFFFSFVLSAPLYMISARYVADCLYFRDPKPIPGIFIFSLVLMAVPCILIASLFYGFYANLTILATALSVVNFVFLSQIWIVMLYLGTIRDFRAITLSWVIGMMMTIFFSIALGRTYKSTGMLMGLDLGLIFLLYSLKAQILAEYPFRFVAPKGFKFYYKSYNGLFWSGFFLFAGMWIDKVIMWAAPEGYTHLNHLRTYPVYDGGMFVSYLSIIPVMALFIFSLETNFYDSYIYYVQHIERNEPYSLIEEERKNILSKIADNGRSFLVLQGSISIIVIALTGTIFKWIGGDFLQIGIFRFGALGAFFAALNLFIVIFFSYFDSQKNMLVVTGTMLLSNALFTSISLEFGFPYYGCGYCLSMIFTFLIGATLFIKFLNNLTYNIFIINVVKRQRVTSPLEEEERKRLRS